MASPADSTLVILAAGLGARYGGDKQLDPIGPTGQLLSDYSIEDAIAEGIGEVVVVIREELRAAFAVQHRRFAHRARIRYVPQRLDDVPPHFAHPRERSKPWGTTHALLAAREVVRGPCLVLNADDYYGPEAIRSAVEFLRTAGPLAAANIAYPLADTLSPHGPVSRALLGQDAEGWLVRITERHDLTVAEAGRWPPDTVVSMNCWALGAGVLPLLSGEFSRFLATHGDSPTAECPLPESLGALAHAGAIRIRIIPAGRGWIGVTHPADRAAAMARLPR